MTVKERNSNFEFLRIIMMLLIVFHHSIVHGVIPQGPKLIFTLNRIWIHDFICSCFAMFGKMGVVVFVMISGFFLVKSNFSYGKMLSKVLKIIIQVYFYSLLIFLFTCYFHLIPINVHVILQAVFPFFYNTYWFALDYLLLYLVYPYINILINNLTQKQHLILILILMSCFTIVPLFVSSFVSNSTLEAFILFVMFYIIGSYIRLYPIKNTLFDKKMGKFIFFITIVVTILLILLNVYLGQYIGNIFFIDEGFNITGQYSFLTIIMAVSLMYWVKNWRPHTSKTINFISATTFGVYLIHDNPITETVLWNNWLHMPTLFMEPTLHLILVVLVVCPIVFIVCSLIDSLRLIIFNFVQKFFVVKSNWRIQNNVK